MPPQQKLQMPGVFGGLMKYDEEYRSRFMISPAMVVGFIIFIIVFVVAMKIFFPVSAPAVGVGPVGQGGFILALLR